MPRRVVTTPDGVRWTVRRRWVPRLGNETVWGRFHRRFRRVVERITDGANVGDPGCLDVLGEGFVAGIAVILLIFLLVFVIVPLLVAIVDVLVVLLLGVLGFVGRALFRRPWVVQASADDGRTVVWRIVGWRASGEQEEQVARSLRSSGTVPQ